MPGVRVKVARDKRRLELERALGNVAFAGFQAGHNLHAGAVRTSDRYRNRLNRTLVLNKDHGLTLHALHGITRYNDG